MSKIMENGLSLPGEPEGKCCWCIPLKIGVILIGLSMIATAISNVLLCLGNLGDHFIYGVLFGAAAAPILLGVFYYVKWFMAMEDSERKNGLFRACLMVIFTSVITVGVFVIMTLLVEGVTFGSLISRIVGYGINAVFFLYFAGACKKFAAQ